MTRALRPLAALIAVVLICAGCGSNGSDGASRNNPRASNRDKAVTFSECMRTNGVKAFPDPDASGELTIDGVLNGSSLDPNSAAWRRATAACKELQPAGFTGHKASPQEQDVRLKFAQCIRDSGVKDFPDPAKDAPLVDTNRIPSANAGNGLAVLNAAMRKCGETFRDGLGIEGP